MNSVLPSPSDPEVAQDFNKTIRPGRKASVITHHDHTRQALDNHSSMESRFSWSARSLISEIPLLVRNRASKPPDMTDEQDDMLFYRGYTHGLWSFVSKLMDRGICIIAGILSIFLVYRIVDLQISLRQEEASQFYSLDDPNKKLSTDHWVQHIFSDIKWILIEGMTVISLIVIHLVLLRARDYHSKRISLHETEFPNTPLKYAMPYVLVTILALSICILSHTGVLIRILIKFDDEGQASFVTELFGAQVFQRSISPSSMLILSSLSDIESNQTLSLPRTAYIQFSDMDTFTSSPSIDFENTGRFTKWMIQHVAIGFRLAFLFFLFVLLPLFITPRWREVCLLHAINLLVWLSIATAVFVRFSSTPIAPAVILVMFLLLSFLVSFVISIMLPLVAALLYEQSQVVDSNRKNLFRWSFHEVRVPCTAILSGTTMLASDPDVIKALSRDARNSLFDVALSTRQLSNVLNNVLEWERSSQMGMTLQYSSVQLNVLLRETLGMFATAAKSHNLKVAVKFPSKSRNMHSVQVKLDQQKVYHILLNMMSNCIKYARTHITVHVCILPFNECEFMLEAPRTGQIAMSETASLPTKELRSKVSPSHDDLANTGALIFQIVDDGPGMSASVLGMYSKEFGMGTDTGSNAGSSIRNTGTGLGAHITGKMLEAHGGRMCLRSSKDVGTAVTILVPIPMAPSQLEELSTPHWRALALMYPEVFLSGFSSIREFRSSSTEDLWCNAKNKGSDNELDMVRSGSDTGNLLSGSGGSQENPLQDKHVLLVEDDKLVVRVLERSLVKNGAKVWVAMDGCEALCMLAKTYSVDEPSLITELATARSWEEAGRSRKPSGSSGLDPLSGQVIRSAKISTSVGLQSMQKWKDWAVSHAQQSWKPHQTKRPCPQQFDLILTDMNMPHLSGLSLCESVRRWRKEYSIQCKVVGLTGNALDEDLQLFMHHGADHALAKPLQMGMLQSFLQSQWGPTHRPF